MKNHADTIWAAPEVKLARFRKLHPDAEMSDEELLAIFLNGWSVEVAWDAYLKRLR